jgi:hypothetical protein
MFFHIKVLVFSICHSDDECCFVSFISNCNLGITGQVKSINLVEEINELFSCKTVVDRYNAYAGLLQELNMGTGNVTWHSFNSISNWLVILEQVTTNGLCKNTDHGSLAVIDLSDFFRLFILCNHVIVCRLLNPSFFEVSSAEEKRVLLCNCALNLAYGNKNRC